KEYGDPGGDLEPVAASVRTGRPHRLPGGPNMPKWSTRNTIPAPAVSITIRNTAAAATSLIALMSGWRSVVMWSQVASIAVLSASTTSRRIDSAKNASEYGPGA